MKQIIFWTVQLISNHLAAVWGTPFPPRFSPSGGQTSLLHGWTNLSPQDGKCDPALMGAPKAWWEPELAAVCSTNEKFEKGNLDSCWFSGSLSTWEEVLFPWNAPKIQPTLTTNSPHGKTQHKLNTADGTLSYSQGSGQWGRYLVCQFGKHIHELCLLKNCHHRAHQLPSYCRDEP